MGAANKILHHVYRNIYVYYTVYIRNRVRLCNISGPMTRFICTLGKKSTFKHTAYALPDGARCVYIIASL